MQNGWRRKRRKIHSRLWGCDENSYRLLADDRPSHFLQWAHETFGDIALDRHERALRFVEEAIELAHAIGLQPAVIGTTVDRVYSRPPGAIPKEIGQCLATLELLARVVNVDADSEATAELARVKSIPKGQWEKRHAAKVALGIAKA
jgi:NTP pyrophosphatase (non-canonical NTP hydrolase)